MALRKSKIAVTLHLTEEAAEFLCECAGDRSRGWFISHILMEKKKEMATMEAASGLSAKQLNAGSTPAVASVWVFNVTGEMSFFPHAVFSTRKLAEDWILEKRPVGVLTRYVLDKPGDPDFPEHYHYEDEDDYAWLERRLKG